MFRCSKQCLSCYDVFVYGHPPHRKYNCTQNIHFVWSTFITMYCTPPKVWQSTDFSMYQVVKTLWIKLSLNFIVFCYWQYLNKYYLIKLNLSPFFKTKSEFSIMNSNLGLFINNSIISSQLWHYWRRLF